MKAASGLVRSDLGKAAVGLVVSVVVALGVPFLANWR
jgi:hypothetical protein